MNHDALFKELLYVFFGDFLTLFFPTEAAQLDLSSVQFLSQEAFTDFPEGRLRRADVLAEVRTKAGAAELILVHIEIQAQRALDVPFRMWEYYHLFRLRYHKPIFPIVLYLAPGAGGITIERYNEDILGRVVLSYEYAVVGLPDLSARDYENLGSPLSIALSALMRSTEADPVARKLRGLVETAGSDLDEARKLLLATIVDRYLPLDAAQSTELISRLELISENGASETMSIYSIIREDALQQGMHQGMRQGMQQGIQQGMLQGRQITLIHLMQAKFGPLPNSIVSRIEQTDSSEVLDNLLTRILSVDSIEAMGFGE